MTDDALVDPFFGEEEFTTYAIYQASDGDPVTIPVIFDRENSVTPIGSVAIENAAPQAICRTSDVIGVNNAGTLTVGAVVYNIKEVQPTATGTTTLILTKH